MRKKEFYKTTYSSPNGLLDIDRHRIEPVVSFAGANKKVLDVGCYNGTIGALLKEKNNNVFGVDLSKNALKFAKDRGLITVVADTERGLPFKNERFDTAIATEVIEHIFDVTHFLEEIRRVLKQNGQLVVTTPNISSLSNRIRMVLGMDIPALEVDLASGRSGHIRYFTKSSLRRLLEMNGFKIEAMKTDLVVIPLIGKIFNKTIFSVKLATIFPNIGRTLIFSCKRI